MKPISVQLYSLREMAKDDFVGVLKAVADMGYKGVEPAGLFDLKPEEVRRIVEDLGMTVSSNHGPLPTADNCAEVVDITKGLGCKYPISGFRPDDFETLDAIKATAERAAVAVEKMKEGDLTFAIHNHWWEFNEVDGRLGYDILMEMVPELRGEVDTYWAANFGAVDPTEVVARHKDRVPLLHIKDGPLVQGEAHTAVGKGKMDIPAVVAAADEDVLEWLVVELDNCDTDMAEAVAESCRYLAESGLGEANE